MNIVFFGSSQFAVPCLQALLITRHKISCVVTQPDRKKGRGLHLEGTPVKLLASEVGLKVYQPAKINTAEAHDFLKSLKPDLFVVVAYGHILSQKVLDIPSRFSINAHASLLPEFRGAAPINWAIIKGKKKTGITIMKMSEKMDAGEMILQEAMEIRESDTAVSMEGKLSMLAASLLIRALSAIEEGKFTLTKQDESKATLAPKIEKGTGLIHWDKPAQELHCLIRGCMGWPGAYTHYKGKMIKIYEAGDIRLSGYEGKGKPGQILEVSKDGIVVATGKGEMIIKELQPEGKRIMKAAEFIAGHKITTSDRFI
jgi:methionyl-tRNA formyltransferase